MLIIDVNQPDHILDPRHQGKTYNDGHHFSG